MSSGVELVLFYGPPFIGKTLHYIQRYSKTHTRISASDIFREDKCSNLRLVILKVISLLSQGKNVVIDDENWYVATRQSYTGLVKKKVPNCTFKIVQFTPDITWGYQYCLWVREWALVEETLLENKDYNSTLLSESNERLDCWFARRRCDLSVPEPPTAQEGFSVVKVKPRLMCKTSCKLTLPALFIQWQAILVDIKDEILNINPAAPNVLNKWSGKNPSGRIIVIGPKTRNGSDIMEEETKTLLLQLTSQLTSPLYFTFIDEKHQLDLYSRFPQPGVLAFLQKLHTVNLNHKGTIYVYSSDNHYRAASSVGVRTIKATKLLAHPHLIDSVSCGDTNSNLPFLRNILQVNCSASDNEIEKVGSTSNNKTDKVVSGCTDTSNEETPSEAQIPFFSRARKSSSLLTWKYCYGKVNGVCFKDKLVLERYQTQYKLAAKPAQPPGKTKPKSSATVSSTVSSRVPHQLSKASSSVSLSAPQAATTKDTPSSESEMTAREWVKTIDLREVAQTIGRYLGGYQCTDNMFDKNVEVLERRLKIKCKCSGSSELPYEVEVVLNESSGIQEARCSCPDVAGKIGRCKHVIGLLLNYKEPWRQNLRHVDPVDKASSSDNSRKSDEKKINNKRDVQTLYCMSQEELLETAKEILQKHTEQLTQQQSSMQDPDVSVGHVTKDRSTEEAKGDILAEVLFSAIKGSGKSPKKACPERIPSFAEDTPLDNVSCLTDSVTTVIIPDSLVPETVSLVPETIFTESMTHSSCEELESTSKQTLESDKDCFEAFLNEMI